MNKKEIIENAFNEKFWKIYSHKNLLNSEWMTPYPLNEELKQYIFETIIPEVLKSVIPNYIEKPFDYLDIGNNWCINGIKRTAKELYDITL